MRQDFDVLVIGSGGAGVAAAIQATDMGATVGIAEGGTLGGTCVNVGCIPSKNLIEAAGRFTGRREAFPGTGSCDAILDWNAVRAQKDALVADLRQAKYADVIASYSAVELLSGTATLLGGQRVTVGGREITPRKIVVATGARPALPSIPGLELVDALDSTSAMAVEKLPASLLVLGGSAVGLELGQAFARLGVRVTVVELRDRLLPAEDEDVSHALQAALEAEGIEVHVGTSTERVEPGGEGVVLHTRRGRLERSLSAERLLVATGRAPNTGGFGLDAAGVTLTQAGFIRVDARMQTSNSSIYAAGDVTGGPGYVYVAAAGGRVAAENAVNTLDDRSGAVYETRELDLSSVPGVTFTSPQVASIGLAEKSARDAGYDVQTSVLSMDQVPRALVSYRTAGFVKLVAETGTGKLLGVHALGEFAGELMGEASLALRFGMTWRDIAGTLHPYLTWGEAFKLAAQGFASNVRKLSCCA